MKVYKKFFYNKTIVITGVCGTVGTELLIFFFKNFKELKIKSIVGLDNNENQIFNLSKKFINKNFNFYVSDICNYNSFANFLKNSDILYHCAAHKHVLLSELSPIQTVETNINGLINIIKAGKEYNLSKIIFTSSDKAVNPTGVMGVTKLLGEKISLALNSDCPKVSLTRFGNIIGSNGSVFEIFYNQLINNKAITITEESMTRFVMLPSSAAKLVIDSSIQSSGGEIFITKMPALRIIDLAKALEEYLFEINKIKKINFNHKFIGTSKGEKMYEELMTLEEQKNVYETDKFYIIKNIHQNKSEITNFSYNSSTQKLLTIKEIKKLISNYFKEKKY